MSDFQLSGSGKMSLLRSLLFSREMGWTHTGRFPLLTVVWLIPGESLWAPCTSLPLPGVSGRLHGDGSAWHLLHLLITKLRGQGCAGGCVSREVRACSAKEQFLALCSASSLAPPARTLLVLFLPTMGKADLLLHSVAQAFQEPKSAFSAVLGSVSLFSWN